MGALEPRNLHSFSVAVLGLYWEHVPSTCEDEEVLLSATILLQLPKHCTGVCCGGRWGRLRSHSCFKHPGTLMRKHQDSSGVFGKVNGACVTLVFTSPHPPTHDDKPRYLHSPLLAGMKGRHPGVIPRVHLGLNATARPSTHTFKFTRRLITRDSRLHPQCTEGWQVKGSSISHDI